MKEVFDFCVENKLISARTADFLRAMYERQSPHPINLVIDSGVDEKTLYRYFARESQLEIFKESSEAPTEDLKQQLSPNVCETFNCFAVDYDARSIKVVSWNWLQSSVIPQALKNITGKDITLELITCTDFNRLKPIYTND